MIAHISDTHLGTRPRRGVRNIWKQEKRITMLEYDFYKVFEEALQKITERKDEIEVVVHSGDFFEYPYAGASRPPHEVTREFVYEKLKKFFNETKIPLVIIDGNHGCYSGYFSSSLDPLKHVFDKVYVVTQRDLREALVKNRTLKIQINGLSIYCFPYMFMEVLEKANMLQYYRNWIRNKQNPEERRSIAVVHGMQMDNTLPSEILENKYTYIALGHFHKMKKISERAWYAGSTCYWRFDEAGQKKGFLFVDIEQDPLKVEYIPLDPPHKMIVKKIKVTADMLVEQIENLILKVLEAEKIRSGFSPENSFRVKIVIEGLLPVGKNLLLYNSLERLEEEFLTSEEWNIIQFVWEIKTEPPPSTHFPMEIQDEILLIEDPEKEFDEYISQLEIPQGLDKKLLIKLASAFIESTFNNQPVNLNEIIEIPTPLKTVEEKDGVTTKFQTQSSTPISTSTLNNKKENKEKRRRKKIENIKGKHISLQTFFKSGNSPE